MTTYEISDGNAIEVASDFDEMLDIVNAWYGFMGEIPPFVNPTNRTVYAVNRRISCWEAKIAEASGYTDFHGHGRYVVSAADQMGLCLCVKEVEVDEESFDEDSE